MLFGIAFVHWLVVLSACISVVGASAYIRDTLRGTTKPNRVSWALWALAPIVGVAAALSVDADPWAAVRVFLAGFLPLLVFLASFVNRNSYWKLTRFDLICGVLSVVAIVVWAGADSPRAAIVLLAIADTFAALPTILKAWRHPETETGITYLLSLISVAITIPSIPTWNIENAAFPIYLLTVNATLVVAVYRKRDHPSKNIPSP